jgi:hypothetical protein
MSEEVKAKLKGEVGEDQLRIWKEKYPNGVYSVVVESSIGYIRAPGRLDISDAQMQANSLQSTNAGDAFSYKEAIVTKCWIGGDDSLLNDERKLLAVFSVASGLIDIPTARLEKL